MTPNVVRINEINTLLQSFRTNLENEVSARKNATINSINTQISDLEKERRMLQIMESSLIL